MRYLCALYLKEPVTPPAEEGLDEESLEYNAALAPADSATTLRIRRGRVHISDGPFARTREPLAGWCVIESRDLNEAIQLAARMPAARLGTVEVRPLIETKSFEAES